MCSVISLNKCLHHRINQRPWLPRGYGNDFGRTVREKQRSAQTARAPRTLGSTRRSIWPIDRDIALHSGRTEKYDRRVILSPNYRPNTNRAVRMRYLYQLSANCTTLANHHQQSQNLPLFAMNVCNYIPLYVYTKVILYIKKKNL